MKMKPRNPTPIIIGFEGTGLNQTLQQHLLKINPAGIVLFKRNIISLKQTRTLVHQIRELLGQILVAVDHEGGMVNRFPEGCPVPPSLMGLGRINEKELLMDACRMQAELLAYLGVNLNFAPVLDLATDERNPAIGTRAFSARPDDIINYGRICMDAHRKLAIATTAKHFPGHGRSPADSHYGTGEVLAKYDKLWNEDLRPFRELIKHGIPVVMPAHLMYPSLDLGIPAMFSRKIMTDLLRDKLGFQGLVVSDCVEMAAVSDSETPSRIVQKGVSAGVDLFISSFSLKKSLEFQLALKEALDRELQELPDDNRKPELTVERLHEFLEAYPGKLSNGSSLSRESESVVQMHCRTIEMRRHKSLPEGYQNFFLVELSGDPSRGINADEQWGPVSTGLLKTVKSIRQHQILADCRLETINRVIEKANLSHLTVVLITANGFRREGFRSLLQQLEKADAVIHISLIDDRDVSGNLDNEWVTWGYNHWTAAALKRELLSL